MRTMFLVTIAALTLSGCGDNAQLPSNAGYGPNPSLPAPKKETIPTMKIAPAKGWPAGAMPVAPTGFTVTAFARDLDHPRWLYVLPNGDVLVAETNAPPKPEDGKSIMGFIQGQVMKMAGAGTPSANRITLLRDRDGDGVAETRRPFLTGLNSPFGMVLVGDNFYVAATDAVLRFAYQEGAMQLTGPGERIVDLPAGPRNHHWTKNIIASPDGAKLYVTVGSNSNVGENGMAAEEGRAAIWEVDPVAKTHRIFASGLRNPNAMFFTPNGTLWTAVNERDELGGDLVPDYMTSVRDGGFYGWPYSYYGQHVDARVTPQRPDLVAKAIAPDYALGAHTGSLGAAFSDHADLAPGLAHGAFVSQHGSWNRKPVAGYRVIFVPFHDDRASGSPRELLTGFLTEDGKAQGRPVGLAIDKKKGLLVADDVGNTVWRVAQ
jgi:glucose/arabinose dehydrogenase